MKDFKINSIPELAHIPSWHNTKDVPPAGTECYMIGGCGSKKWVKIKNVGENDFTAELFMDYSGELKDVTFDKGYYVFRDDKACITSGQIELIRIIAENIDKGAYELSRKIWSAGFTK